MWTKKYNSGDIVQFRTKRHCHICIILGANDFIFLYKGKRNILCLIYLKSDRTKYIGSNDLLTYINTL